MCIVSEPRCQNVVGHFRVNPSPRLPSVPWQEMCLANSFNERRRKNERLRDLLDFSSRHSVDEETGFLVEKDWPQDSLVTKYQRKYKRALGRSVWTASSPDRSQQKKKEMVWAKLAGGSQGTKGGKNFMIFQIDMGTSRACFTFFPKSGDVVVCGNKSEEEMRRAADRFCAVTGTTYEKSLSNVETEYLDPKLHEEYFSPIEPWVTNMTWSGVIGCRGFRDHRKPDYIMRALAKYCEDNKHNSSVSVQMRSTFFPGAYLRHEDYRGVINVFSNGSYVIVGVRNEREARTLQKWLRAIMAEYWTTRGHDQSCACNADLSSVTLSEADQTLRDKFGGEDRPWEHITEGFYYKEIAREIGQDARQANIMYNRLRKRQKRRRRPRGIKYLPFFFEHHEETLNSDGGIRTVSNLKQMDLDTDERDGLFLMLDKERPMDLPEWGRERETGGIKISGTLPGMEK